MKKYLLHPATFKLDGGAMFGIIPKPLWQKKIIPDDKNRILMSLRVVYLELGERKILIDTGIGDYHSEKFNHQFDIQGKEKPIEALLKEYFQIGGEAITDIILTHLHFDHVGGLGTGENSKELAFPNATIHLHKKHFEYSLKPTVRDQGSFHTHFYLPLIEKYKDKNQIHFLNDDSGVIMQEGDEKIEYVISKGHTPYMIHPIFDKYIYMADLVPMEHHINLPWVMGYDIEPGVTTQFKEQIYKLIMQRNLKMIFEHDHETLYSSLAQDERKSFIAKDSVKAASPVEKLA
ncbi:MAG: hypothetical protein CME62_17490 [Halobacteriovoraceae bacterium]|nr:hypothetical protein [Halobacteriovoraceae bacterium]